MKKNGKKFGSDFKKIDAHRTTRREYEELPEPTPTMLAKGVFKRNGKPVGRPPKPDKKVSIHLRIDPDIRDAFKATGQGWQSRMNEALRAAIIESRLL